MLVIWPIPCSCAACWPRLAITYMSMRETYRVIGIQRNHEAKARSHSL